MAGAFSPGGGTVLPTIAEDLLTKPYVRVVCRKMWDILVNLLLHRTTSYELELYEMVTERNYAMVLARHRINLLAISIL